MSIFHGIAGKRTTAPLGICFHNDAGSQNATCSFYSNWLPNHEPSVGFAHYYVCSDGILQAEDEQYKAWHCGNSYGNANYISIEICQSMGGLEVFKSNEDFAINLARQILKKYSLTPNAETVKLHQDFASTACPHRSMEIHGGREATRKYFIKKLSATTAIANDQKGEKAMQCFYTVDGSPNVYWFNGDCVRLLTNPDQVAILNRIYKDINGIDIPTYKFTSSAPWHKRLIQATVCEKLSASDGKIG